MKQLCLNSATYTRQWKHCGMVEENNPEDSRIVYPTAYGHFQICNARTIRIIQYS